MGIKMTMRKGEISLDGYGRRKSFYGKCGVREVNGVNILRSYDTDDYAAESGGVIVALSSRWSATSGSHLAAFAAFCGVEWHGKKSWDAAPSIPHRDYTESELVDAVKMAAAYKRTAA